MGRGWLPAWCALQTTADYLQSATFGEHLCLRHIILNPDW